jgi:hypothetical protein
VIELIGNPMPGGGFVMSFTDITAFREAEQALKGVNESLEQRVSRTDSRAFTAERRTDRSQGPRRSREPVENPFPRSGQP